MCYQSCVHNDETANPLWTSVEAAISWLRVSTESQVDQLGLSVTGTFQELDDPVLLGPDGAPVDTWRQGHPYGTRMTAQEYEAEKRLLQIELLRAQTWLQQSGNRLVVTFDGRDAAGKGSTIKRFVEHLNPRAARVVALPAPNDIERGQWFFQRYIQHLPTAGEMVLFDRSWHNRAVVELVMGFCTPSESEEFLRAAPLFEEMLVNAGITLVKLWFSVTQLEQITRFAIRRIDPMRQWKLSPIDLASLDRWDEYTAAKDAMFRHTHNETSPWVVVRTNDKKRGRLEAMRHVLSRLDYPDKNHDLVARVDPLIAGAPPGFDANSVASQ